MKTSSTPIALLVGFGLALVGVNAAAQTAVVLDRFEPAPAGDQFLTIRDVAISDETRVAAEAVFGFARKPLFLAPREDGSLRRLDGFINAHWTSHALLSLEVWKLLQLELDLPLVLEQNGDGGQPGLASPSAFALSDLRLSATLELAPQVSWVPGAAGWVVGWVPTGDETAYAGRKQAKLGMGVSLGARYGDFAYGAQVGARQQLQGTRLAEALNADLSFGAGVLYAFDPVVVALEVFGSTAASQRVRIFKDRSTTVETALSAKWKRGPWALGAAFAPSLQRGAGAPEFRVLSTLAYAPERAYESQPVPAIPERIRLLNFSPRPQSAKGAAEAKARVEQVPRENRRASQGKAAATKSTGGVSNSPACDGPSCADSDADGIVDADDRCPNQAGIRSLESKRFGCPADSDNDGLADVDDACPREAGPATDDKATNGCPESVRVSGSQIVIMQRVSFETGKAEVAESSFDLLRQVAEALNQHAEIVRVAIDGHTDNVGNAKRNTALSRKRALAVLRWLVANGVDERRLEARGFGPKQPLADNKTEQGRAQNRRVEFTIVRREAAGRAAWKDGQAGGE